MHIEFENSSEYLGRGYLIEIEFPISDDEKQKLDKILWEELYFYENEIKSLLNHDGQSDEFKNIIEYIWELKHYETKK